MPAGSNATILLYVNSRTNPSPRPDAALRVQTPPRRVTSVTFTRFKEFFLPAGHPGRCLTWRVRIPWVRAWGTRNPHVHFLAEKERAALGLTCVATLHTAATEKNRNVFALNQYAAIAKAYRLLLSQSEMEVPMEAYSPDFSLQVQKVKGFCPAGETYAKQQMERKTIPVMSCEGPCIRGEIARLAANYVAQDIPSLARACHAETFFVPYSAMASWVKAAERSIMIDGCFLKCHGRVLKGLVGEEKMIEIDALPFYMKYTDTFLMDDVPEEERKAVARQVADRIIAKLKEDGTLITGAA